ncbi:MAG: PAS domain S-box protein [Bryobacteraceae bacterium]
MDLALGLVLALFAAGVSIRYLLRFDPSAPAYALYGSPLATPAVRLSRDAVIQLDPSLNIMDVNPAAESLLGYRAAQLRGMPATFLLAGIARAQLQRWQQSRGSDPVPLMRDPSTAVPTDREASEKNWLATASMTLADDLTVINGFADILLASAADNIAELAQIRRAGERAVLTAQQLPVLGETAQLSCRSVDLNQLVPMLEPRLRVLVSPDVELALTLAAGSCTVRGHAQSLAIAIGAVVADADRAMGGRGQMRISAIQGGLRVETSAPRSALERSDRAGYIAAEAILKRQGGEVRLIDAPSGSAFQLSLNVDVDGR